MHKISSPGLSYNLDSEIEALVREITNLSYSIEKINEPVVARLAVEMGVAIIDRKNGKGSGVEYLDLKYLNQDGAVGSPNDQITLKRAFIRAHKTSDIFEFSSAASLVIMDAYDFKLNEDSESFKSPETHAEAYNRLLDKIRAVQSVANFDCGDAELNARLDALRSNQAIVQGEDADLNSDADLSPAPVMV